MMSLLLLLLAVLHYTHIIYDIVLDEANNAVSSYNLYANTQHCNRHKSLNRQQNKQNAHKQIT